MILHGDCLDRLPALDAESVDAVVTDPPYGLEFMGKEWDKLGAVTERQKDVKGWINGSGVMVEGASGPFGGTGSRVRYGASAKSAQAWHEEWAREVYRVLKPGGHLLAFGGTRTYHRLTCAIEDAGFEIRDCLMWVYGSGFPKGKRVNADPAFCQCALPGHSAVSTDLEQQRADRSGTAADASDDVPARAGARRSMRVVQGSLADCQQDCDSDDAPLLCAGAAGLASVPSQVCAPERIHSDEPCGALASAPSHSPSAVRHSGHLSSLDCLGLAGSVTVEHSRKQENTSRADTVGSQHHTQGKNLDVSSNHYSTGFPRCEVCGKPNADGWNVALKPAYEPIVLARKPLIGTVAQNIQQYGTGALNIDSCRVGYQSDADYRANAASERQQMTDSVFQRGDGHKYSPGNPTGRWPANLIHDGSEEVVGLFPQTGISRGGSRGGKRGLAFGMGAVYEPQGFGDAGSAARFFYTAKASRRERGEGNTHPTVKPLALMRYLVRLVTPPDGLVLDPFCGSGTTGIAAILEGFRFLGIEQDAAHAAMAERRIREWTEQPQPDDDDLPLFGELTG